MTRIPARSLGYLESGQFEKLPADVFVRGFLRSYARCVGLDADETIRRYTRCGMTPAPVASPLAEELANSMARLDDPADSGAVRHVTTLSASTQEATDASRGEGVGSDSKDTSETVAAVSETRKTKSEPSRRRHEAGEGKRRRQRRKRKQHLARQAQVSETVLPATIDIGELPEAAPDSPGSSEIQPSVGLSAQDTTESSGEEVVAAVPVTAVVHEAAAPAGETPGEAAAADEVDVTGMSRQRGTRRATRARKPQAHRPVLVIDDDRPEDAERIQEERAERADASWRSFLPPSLLDNDEGSHRGALTLAVIILVIVATLTMSYLLRRPSGSGDGVTYEQVGIGAPAARA